MSLSSPVTVGPARPGDFAAVAQLLRRVQLPPDGLEAHQETLLVARVNGQVVGCAALEIYDDGALLRSVAVERDVRGAGLGQRLTRAALGLARQHDVSRVYLLTETAGDFFPRFGFETIPRSEIAPGVQQSVEFKSVCPETAQAMMLVIEGKG